MKRITVFVTACLLILGGMLPLMAQNNTAAEVVVPRLVNYSGKALDAQGRPLSGVAGVTFSIYKDQYDGAPLWLETQNVQADSKGNYTIQLGATKPEGLPLELFTSGEARWLGVRVNSGEEQPRVLLLSVPYALKAADAETVGGLPPSAFVLSTPATSNGSSSATPSTTVQPLATGTTPVTTAGGTANKLAKFDANADITTSIVFDNGTNVGIGNTAPAAKLDISGPGIFRGVLTLPAVGAATATAGKASQPMIFTASAFNSGTAAAVNQTFRWQAEAVGNNSATPSGKFNLLFGSGTTAPIETGLSISSRGLITFAAGQIFPGTVGSVKSVGLSAPASDFTVSGSPVTGTGTLALKWIAAPTNANTASAIVKRDATGSFDAGAITASLGVTSLSSSPSIAGVSGTNTSGGYGLYGLASGTTGQGVWGESYGTANANGLGPDGVHGVTHSNAGSGVAGLSTGSTGIGVYGQGGGFGVYAVAANNGRLLASGTGVYGGSTLGTGVSGASFSGAGVSGSSSSGAGVSGTSSLGPGVYGSNPNGFGFATDSNVQQARSAGGWVKAMVYMDTTSDGDTIVRCFNSTLAGAAATTPPCGFAVVYPPLAYGRGIDFGFQVDDRFILAQTTYNANFITTCVDSDPNCHAYDYVPTANQVLVQSWDDNGNEVGNRYYLVVY